MTDIYFVDICFIEIYLIGNKSDRVIEIRLIENVIETSTFWEIQTPVDIDFVRVPEAGVIVKPLL